MSNQVCLTFNFLSLNVYIRNRRKYFRDILDKIYHLEHILNKLHKRQRLVPPGVRVLKCGDATLIVYQGKPRRNVCILSTMHTDVGTFSGAKAKPESVM